MSDHYVFEFPTLINFGQGVSNLLGNYLDQQAIRRPLFVTDANLSKQPFFPNLIEQSGGSIIYDHIPSIPTKQSVVNGKEVYNKHGCDAVIGVGGGTAIDAARAIALSIHHSGDLFDYSIEKRGAEKISKKIPPFITIPTACGTGSEVSRGCVITDKATSEKAAIYSPRLIAQAVFADPELSLELPPSITASTGIIALSNNIEAFLAKNFHPMCDGVALEGVRLVFEHLPKAVKKGDMESRAGMMMAALMGSVAQQKGQGVIHAAAHSLSSVFNTPYGIANAIMLPHGLEFNIPQSPRKLQQLSDTIWSHDFIRSTKELAETLELPRSLKEIGVSEGDVAHLSALAYQTPYHSYNPRPVQEKDFADLYLKALKS